MNRYSHALLATIFFYCTAAVADSSVDVRLIGTWQGEYDEKDGSLKSWVQTRSENGTYQIEFHFAETDGTVDRLAEEGKWWIENGLFYEIALSWMTQPDVYQYRFLDNGCIEFLLVESYESAEDVGHYRFVECLSNQQPSI
jgi:hypothetical protein